jgi:hypothetical protein
MSIYQLLLIVLTTFVAVTSLQVSFTSPSFHYPSNIPTRRCITAKRVHFFALKSSPYSSETNINFPPPPKLNLTPLPLMLTFGLFLFATSVPSSQQSFATALLKLCESALRSDPTVTMELGMTLEAGGVYTSSYSKQKSEELGGGILEQLVLQFQINGGNAWAQGVAYGVRISNGEETDQEVRLVCLKVANMDAVLNGQSFRVPLTL